MDTASVIERLRQVRSGLGCSPAELAALGALVAGAMVALGVLWLRTPPAEAPTAEPAAPLEGASGDETIERSPDVVAVHVAGAVREPGLYELPGDARVADALEVAGGATGAAALEGVNLARGVRDGERLVVPDEAALEDGDGASGGGSGRVDVNRASAADLERLPGVGPVTAERLIAHREEHGPFVEPADLLQVPGIGERTLETLSDLLDL